MFKVKVHYKDKDIILSSDFWPEFVGCRPYFYKRRADISSKNTSPIMTIYSDIKL